MAVRSINSQTLQAQIKKCPSFIKYVNNPSVDTLVSYAYENYEILTYVDHKYKTLEVLVAMLNKLNAFEMHGWRTSYYIKSFTQEVRDQLGMENITKLCKLDSGLVFLFSEVPYDIYLKAITEGCVGGIKNIPVKYHNEEVTVLLLSQGKTEGLSLTEEIVDKALAINYNCIVQIPSQFHTAERFKRVFRKQVFSLYSIPKLGIPDEQWDEELAGLVGSNYNNISYIPRRFFSKEFFMKVLPASPGTLAYVPQEIIDEDILIVALCGTGQRDEILRKINNSFFTEEFLLKLAAEDNQRVNTLHGIQNFIKILPNSTLNSNWSADHWVKVIRACPRALTLIDKAAQTPEIVTAFVESASSELIDALSSTLNKRLLKKHHVPFLIGSKDSDLTLMAEKKIKGRTRRTLAQKAEFLDEKMKSVPDSMEIEISDEDYVHMLKDHL